MKLGIDISQIVYQGTGVGRFTQGLVNAILNYDNDNQWFFFFSGFRQNLPPEIENRIKKKKYRLIKFPFPPTVISLLFNTFHHFSKLFTFNLSSLTSLDWFITSDWSEPPLSINKATIVHDLAFIRHPDTVDKKILKTQEARLHHVEKESKIIFADSQATKNDLIKYLSLEPKRIVVNHPGVSIFETIASEINSVLKKYQLEKSFILTVGKLEPRKNLPRLLNAFRKLGNKNVDLVIVGPSGWEQFNNVTKQEFANIKFLGLIPDNELFFLYKSCLFFIYPSLWEGFGYPLVEAMKIGVPIACSKIPPFEEIAGNNAVYFSPYSAASMTESMKKLINNDQLRKKLIENGKIRAKEFSWERYYNTLIKTLNSKRLEFKILFT